MDGVLDLGLRLEALEESASIDRHSEEGEWRPIRDLAEIQGENAAVTESGHGDIELEPGETTDAAEAGPIARQGLDGHEPADREVELDGNPRPGRDGPAHDVVVQPEACLRLRKGAAAGRDELVEGLGDEGTPGQEPDLSRDGNCPSLHLDGGPRHEVSECALQYAPCLFHKE